MNELFKGKRKNSERRSRLNSVSKNPSPAMEHAATEIKTEKTENVSISEEPTEMITEVTELRNLKFLNNSCIYFLKFLTFFEIFLGYFKYHICFEHSIENLNPVIS